MRPKRAPLPRIRPARRAHASSRVGRTGTGWAGFYEPYFAYHEDSDLSIRTWRLGLRVVSVPDAVIVHRYDFSRNSSKYYLIERNRLMFVSTVWSGRALVLLVPPLLALEFAMVLLAARQGWLRDKLRGWGWLVQHRGDILARRRLVQRERLVPDREWMRVLTAHLDTPLVGVPGRRPLNTMMAAYWRLRLTGAMTPRWIRSSRGSSRRASRAFAGCDRLDRAVVIVAGERDRPERELRPSASGAQVGAAVVEGQLVGAGAQEEPAERGVLAVVVHHVALGGSPAAVDRKVDAVAE